METVRCSAALLKISLGTDTEEESEIPHVPPPFPLPVLAVLPTLAGDGKGENPPPGRGDLDCVHMQGQIKEGCAYTPHTSSRYHVSRTNGRGWRGAIV